jgi:cell division transport system permease protein
LPVGLNVALDNVDHLSSGWDSPAQISLFLREDLEADRAQQFQQALAAREDIAGARYVSREEALAEFSELSGFADVLASELSGFADVLASLDENPLPDLVLVTPAGQGGEAASALREELQATPEVAQAVLDMEWLQRLNSLMELSRRLVLAVGGLLVLGVVLILEEIVIVKLVGGSNAFVRRPFLYTGLWYGVGGGVFAATLVALSLWFLSAPVDQLAALYQSGFQLSGLGIMGALNLVILGGLLGLTGAWLAVARHLVEIEPR